jgi:hypothetical protein
MMYLGSSEISAYRLPPNLSLGFRRNIMKSYRFWAGVATVALLCSASFAFGESRHQSQSLATGTSFNVPATLLTFAFAPGGNVGHNFNTPGGNGGNGGNGGGWGGNGGCSGQGGNGGGGNGWGGNGNGWGGGGNGNGGNGNCSVPEGGSSSIYLLLAALACIGAMAFRMRPQPAVQEVK